MSNIVKAGPNTASYPNDANNLDQIKAWMQGAAAAAALNETGNTYKNFVSGPFSTWLSAYEAGRASEPAPAPPNGWDALMTDDGLSYSLVDSGAASGPPVAFTRIVVSPSKTLSSGSGAPGLIFGPVGAIVKQIDGTLWQRVA